MSRTYAAAALALLMSGLCRGAQAAEPGIAVVSFGDYLWLRVDGRPVALEPGSPAYEVPLGARAQVTQGAATLLARDTLLRVDAGDDFTTTAADGQLRLLVNAGAVEVAVPGRPPVLVEAGRFAALTGPDAGGLPAAPAPPAQPRPAAPAPAAPVAVQPAVPGAPAEAPAEFDPLASLASGFSKLARLGRPELKLVLELHPFYRLTQVYDDNIYLVPRDKPDGTRQGGGVLGSWVTTNELGTTWKLPFSKAAALKGSYSARATNYSQQPKTNNAVDQTVGVALDAQAGKGAAVSVYDNYVNTEDPAFSEQVARQRHMTNEVGASLDLERSRRYTLRLAGRHALSKYLDPGLAAQLNRTESSAGLEAGLRVAPKTKVFLAYSRELTHYSAGRRDDSTGHRFGLGVDGRLSARLSGHAQVDWNLRKYNTPAAGKRASTSNVLAAVDLLHKTTRRLDTRLRLFRSLQESTFSGNRFYTATGVGLGATQTLGKTVLALDTTFETDRYPESNTSGNVQGNRRDDLYSVLARLDYRVRPWLSTGLSYERRQRHSKFGDQFDYRDNRTGVTLRVQF